MKRFASLLMLLAVIIGTLGATGVPTMPFPVLTLPATNIAIDAPYVIPVDRGQVRGLDPHRTVISPKTAPSMDGSSAIIRTSNWVTPGGSQSGLATMPTIRDIVVDGNGKGREMDAFPHTSQSNETTYPDLYDGIDIEANAPEIDNVLVNNVPGAGVRIRRAGFVSGFELDQAHNKKRAADQEEGHIGKLRINRCDDGLIIESGTDGKVDNLFVSAVRGDALRDECGAITYTFMHNYGCENGAVFQGGPSRVGYAELENCSVGLTTKNTANGVMIGELRSYTCSTGLADLQCQTLIGIAHLTVDEANTYGVHLGAIGTRILAMNLDITNGTGSKGIVYVGSAQKSHIAATINGPDGGANTNTDIAISVESQIYNNVIEADVLGVHVALNLSDAASGSFGNTFKIHTERADTDVIWPSSGKAAFEAANTVLINGAVP